MDIGSHRDLNITRPSGRPSPKHHGCTIYPAATRLADWLHENPGTVQHKRVLEVGSGIGGLPGMVAHRLGASHVTFTDHDPVVFPLLLKNIEQNCSINNGQYECKYLEWYDRVTPTSVIDAFDAYGTIDVVLGSEVFYYPAQVSALLHTVGRVLTRHHGKVVFGCHAAAASMLRMGEHDGFAIESQITCAATDVCITVLTCRDTTCAILLCDVECPCDRSGHHTSPCAIHLSHLLRSIDVKGKRVLELGCGSNGLVGLAALREGASHVCFTDKDPSVFDVIIQSTQHASDRSSYHYMDWREDTPCTSVVNSLSPRDSHFDVILGADVVYQYDHMTILLSCITRLLPVGGRAIVCLNLRGQPQHMRNLMQWANDHKDYMIDLHVEETIVCLSLVREGIPT